MSSPVRIALFCGGRGSATIIRALLRDTQVSLTLLVNAYDDGLSTGALRNFIPGMLGPSDFRKNFSYLMGNYSSAQYALRNLMEYRLPGFTGADDVEKLARFARENDPRLLAEPVASWFAQLPPALSARMRALLGRFFDHAAGAATPFDYRDCSLGNLVFAGAYLAHGNDFNAAAAEVADMVGSRARLLNIGEQQNRVLTGLKADGSYLSSEAQIVGPQSPVPITDLFLLERPLTAEETLALTALDIADRRAFLAARDAIPDLSPAAAQALAEAGIILYGPGTQHSSLLPSYRIAAAALKAAPARVKAMILNLDSDNDIQGLSASDLADRAMNYGAAITHILADRHGRLEPGGLDDATWRGAAIVRDDFSTPLRPQIHNGRAVADCARALYAGAGAAAPAVEVFADIHNRSVAAEELVEEFLETDWGGARARLVLNRVTAAVPGAQVATARHDGLFPEAGYLRDWLARENGADYLVLMTGDGAYSFRDVQNIIRLLEQQASLGGVFGSRTQSRRQFITSIRAAYGEHRLLYGLGKIAAFLLSTLFYLRSGVILSDPLTGLRVFRRASLVPVAGSVTGSAAPLAIARHLVREGVEVAELPVIYRTFSGFTDPHWRVRRGFRNLTSLFAP